MVRAIDRKPPTPPPVLRSGVSSVSDPGEVANTLGATFAAVSCSSSRTTASLARFRFPPTDNELYNRLFTSRELSSALSSRRSTSPGPDDIPYEMLRHLHPTATVFLLDLYNRIWIEGSYPSSWRHAIVFPILKPGVAHPFRKAIVRLLLPPTFLKFWRR